MAPGPKTRGLLLDEMYGEAIAEGLRRAGHDAVALLSIEDMRATHDLEFAAELGRVLVTNNVRDFMLLDRQGESAVAGTPASSWSTRGRFRRTDPWWAAWCSPWTG